MRVPVSPRPPPRRLDLQELGKILLIFGTLSLQPLQNANVAQCAEMVAQRYSKEFAQV